MSLKEHVYLIPYYGPVASDSQERNIKLYQIYVWFLIVTTLLNNLWLPNFIDTNILGSSHDNSCPMIYIYITWYIVKL